MKKERIIKKYTYNFYLVIEVPDHVYVFYVYRLYFADKDIYMIRYFYHKIEIIRVFFLTFPAFNTPPNIMSEGPQSQFRRPLLRDLYMLYVGPQIQKSSSSSSSSPPSQSSLRLCASLACCSNSCFRFNP